MLALPNVFGEESALQLARDRAAVHATRPRPPSSSCCKDKGVTPTGAFLDQGRLTLRFASKQDQLKARDVIAEARPNSSPSPCRRPRACRNGCATWA